MEIVRTTLFVKSLKKLGASSADLKKLEDAIIANPIAGDVIQGLGGARKLRFGVAGRGKQGGARAIYVLVVSADTTYLLLAYSKKDQGDLSEKQRKVLAALVEELKNG
ncbi:MAG TPA: type II toxin-antitoxin system RelE/ParE family toxin [Rhizomicrobium sp.]|nr:type II toxin-antitoxin system RelE/ParE family toxin [Rhizomicrobium sp.]